MTDLDCSLPVASPSSVDTFLDLAETAESAGYDRVWMPETWGRDAVSVLSTVAERTSDVGIGTSITNVYSRSPALVGQTAATLQELSDGRFRLGLGPSGPILVENWHGVEYERPLRYTRETIDVVRAVLSGETVTYDGDFFSLSGFRLRCDPPEPTPAVDAAALGPKAVELAGRFADGWHALLVTPDGLAERLGALERGAELGDRNPEDVRVTLSVTACVHEDGDVARDLVRNHLAFYVGAMGTFYRDALAGQGYDDTAHAVAREWGTGNPEAAKAAIGDDLLDDLAVAGTPDEARAQLSRFRGFEGVDAVAVGFPRGAEPETLTRTAAVLGPEA